MPAFRLPLRTAKHASASDNGFAEIAIAAAEAGDVPALRQLMLDLMEQGISLSDLRGVNGRTPLHAACRFGQASVCELILTSVTDPRAANACNDAGVAPLHLAAANGNTECIQLLLAHGASALLKDAQNKRSAAEWAAANEQTRAQRMLLAAANANVDACLSKNTIQHHSAEACVVAS